MFNLKLSHDFCSFTLPKLKLSSFIEKCKVTQLLKCLKYRAVVLYMKQEIFLTLLLPVSCEMPRHTKKSKSIHITLPYVANIPRDINILDIC